MGVEIIKYPVEADSTTNNENVTLRYITLLKTGSLDNAIREFSFAEPSWVRSHYTMLYKYGKRTRDFFGRLYCYFSPVFYILGRF